MNIPRSGQSGSANRLTPSPTGRSGPSITRTPGGTGLPNSRTLTPGRGGLDGAGPSISRSTGGLAGRTPGSPSVSRGTNSLRTLGATSPYSRYAGYRSPAISRYPGYAYSRYPSIARYTRGYYGPRFGVPGYASCFTRYSPYCYRPGFFHRPWYPAYYGYPVYRSGFSFGFGFYSNCYAYPTYPLVYYPTYYAPLYPAVVYPTYYASSVLVTAPAYEYVPEPVIEYPTTTYVDGAQYASAATYVDSGAAVEAPEVVYDDGTVAPQDAAAQAPSAEAPAGQYAEAPPTDRDVVIQNHVNVYSEPQDAATQQQQQQGLVTTPQGSEPQVAPQGLAPQGPAAQPLPQEQPVAPAQPRPADIPTAAPAEPAQPPVGELPPVPADGQPQAAPAEPAPAQPQAPADQQPGPAEQAPAGAEGEPEPPQLTPEQIKELQDLMLSGTQGFHEGRYVEAVEKFAKVTETDPHNVDAALAHGVGRFATGDYAAAADSIRLGVGLFPPIVDSVFDVRERYQKKADFVAQVQTLEGYLDKHPDDANAMVVLGFVRHFSNQRDLAEQVFQRLKKASPDDAELADVFLHALPPEEAAALASQPAPADGTLDVRVNRGLPGIPSSQPAGVEGAVAGPANPGVLSVTTQPAPMQKIEIPSDPQFDGKLSLSTTGVPREQPTVDGIEVRLKGTDDMPPQASIEINVADRRMKVKRFIPGAHVVVKGASGKSYKLVLTEVDNKTETIRYMMAEQK